MAGGYDHRVVENVEHHDELTSLAGELNLSSGDVTFLKSPSDGEKLRLLKTSNALLYTPSGKEMAVLPVSPRSKTSTAVPAWILAGTAATYKIMS